MVGSAKTIQINRKDTIIVELRESFVQMLSAIKMLRLNACTRFALSARDCPFHASPDALYIVPHATNRCASL
jgi:hypothetical protein